jgi:hypothetical protein
VNEWLFQALPCICRQICVKYGMEKPIDTFQFHMRTSDNNLFVVIIVGFNLIRTVKVMLEGTSMHKTFVLH